MNHTLLPMFPPLGCHIGFTRGWEVQHSMLVVPTLGKSHRLGVISHHGSLLRFLPLSPSPNLDPAWSFFLSAQLIICLASISIILLPFSSAPLPPSLRQILVCAQLFPVPIASPELRGDGTSLGSCPVMSHVCRVASKGVKRDGP